MPENKEIQEGKIFAVIGYLLFLCFIPLLFKKENKFALFHGRQGLVLFLGEIALFIISIIIGIIPFLRNFIGFFGFLLFGILSLIGMIQALAGNYWRIPVAADLADKFNI